MQAESTNGRVIAHLSALRDRRPKIVVVDGEEIVLVRMGDEVCAISNICPHAGAELGFGFVLNGAIECPAHLAKFDLRFKTGPGLKISRPDQRPVNARR